MTQLDIANLKAICLKIAAEQYKGNETAILEAAKKYYDWLTDFS